MVHGIPVFNLGYEWLGACCNVGSAPTSEKNGSGINFQFPAGL
jgi:hypothetical protein